MKNSIKILKYADLFSIPFSFLVGEKKNIKTILGGIISLLILFASISYLYYLMKMYISDQFEPKITSREFIDGKIAEVQIEKNTIIFEYLINGEPLKQYEKRIGKTYLTYLATFDYFKQDGSWDSTAIPIIQSLEENFSGYLTLDEEAIKDKKIMVDPFQRTNSEFEIEINPCDPSIESNCASEQEILDVIFTPYNYLQTFTKIQQYNPTSRKYEYQYRSEYIALDPYLLIYSRISLLKANHTIKEGILFQSEKKQETINDYRKLDDFFTQKDLDIRQALYGYALLAYDMNQAQSSIVVQFPMITEVLAQFSSIFNSLLLLGIFVRMFAQTSVIQKLNEVLLKQYYKKTALKLINKTKSSTLKRQKSIIEQYNSMLDLQTKINEQDFYQKRKKFFNFGICNQIKIFFSRLFKKIQNGNSEQSIKEEVNNRQIYLKLQNESLSKINILELFKDLYKLKMAIKLILTKEQYAAIHFCGSEIGIENLPIQKKKLHQKSKEINNLKSEQIPKEVQKQQKYEQSLPQSQTHSQSQSPLSEISIQKNFSNKVEELQLENKMKNFPSMPSIGINLQLQIDESSDLCFQKNQTKMKENSDPSSQQKQHYCRQLIEKNIGDNAIDKEESVEDINNFSNEFQNNHSEKQEDYSTINNNLMQLKIPSIQKINFKLQQQQKQQSSQSFMNQDYIFISSQQRSHLQEMDLIEENPDFQKKYLLKFLKKAKNVEQYSSIINNQILQSLLISDFSSLFLKEETFLFENLEQVGKHQKQ